VSLTLSANAVKPHQVCSTIMLATLGLATHLILFNPNSKQHYWSRISCLIHLPHHHLWHWHQLHGQQSTLCHNCLVDKQGAGEPTDGEIHTELW